MTLPKPEIIDANIGDDIFPEQGQLVRWSCSFKEDAWANLREQMESSNKRFCVAYGEFYDFSYEHFNQLADALNFKEKLERETSDLNGFRAAIFLIQEPPIVCIEGTKIDDGVPF